MRSVVSATLVGSRAYIGSESGGASHTNFLKDGNANSGILVHVTTFLDELTFFSSPSSPSLSFFLRPRPPFLSRTFLGFLPLLKHFLKMQNPMQPIRARTTTTMAPTAHVGTGKKKGEKPKVLQFVQAFKQPSHFAHVK